MMLIVIELIAMVAVVVAAICGGWRARRTHRKMIRFSGVTLAAIVVLVLGGSAAFAITGLVKQYVRSASIPDLKVDSTPEQIARGRAIADSFCGGCHSNTGTMTGGRDLAEDIPLPIGSLISANLTPAGLGDWSDGEIFRAVRNSVGKRGKWLIMMSYTNAGRLSDDDIRSLIAYVRSLPAAGAPLFPPHDRLNPLGLAMLGAGLLPGGNAVVDGEITAPPKGPDVQYGAYIMSYQDCRLCHGADLTGGVAGQLAPIGSDLRVVKDWSRDGFIKTMRNGVDPYGHELNKHMPWRLIGRMDDDELTAMYLYLMGTL